MFDDSISASEFREHMKTYMDRANDNSEVIRVTRRNGKKIVILDADIYESLDETAYLTRTPANRKHLEKALKTPEKKYIRYKSVKELKDAFGL